MRKLIIIQMLLFLVFAAVQAHASEYKVGPEDVIKITVYENPDLETLARVENNGTIQFPLVGEIDVAGKSATQISAQLVSLLSDGYLVAPHVSVFVEEFRSSKVVVMGQVNNPGLYEMTGPMTVIELISKAGGFTEIAAQRSLKIIRKAGGKEQTLRKVDFSQSVMADDVIVVPESLF